MSSSYDDGDRSRQRRKRSEYQPCREYPQAEIVDGSSACCTVQYENDGTAYQKVHESLQGKSREAVNVKFSGPERLDNQNANPAGGDIVAEDAGAEKKRQHAAAPAEKESAPVP